MKKRKPLSLRKAEASLQKYYDKLGISKTKVSSPHEIPSYKCEGTQYPSLGTGIGNGAKQTLKI